MKILSYVRSNKWELVVLVIQSCDVTKKLCFGDLEVMIKYIVPVLFVYPRFSVISLKSNTPILLFINSHMYQNNLEHFFHVFKRKE